MKIGVGIHGFAVCGKESRGERAFGRHDDERRR
jgi:hypothetical protein